MEAHRRRPQRDGRLSRTVRDAERPPEHGIAYRVRRDQAERHPVLLELGQHALGPVGSGPHALEIG